MTPLSGPWLEARSPRPNSRMHSMRLPPPCGKLRAALEHHPIDDGDDKAYKRQAVDLELGRDQLARSRQFRIFNMSESRHDQGGAAR